MEFRVSSDPLTASEPKPTTESFWKDTAIIVWQLTIGRSGWKMEQPKAPPKASSEF